MQIQKRTILGMVMVLAVAIVALVFFSDSSLISAAPDYTTPDADAVSEGLKFGKNLAIWFMLMMVAFLMIFIKKYEWGVALAVLLSAAGSFVVYLAIQDFGFGEAWNQELLIRGAICAITVVIAIGVFLGTVRSWQYLLVGILFAPVYALVEWLIGGGITILGEAATDPGGSILVHMCAAYFGLGVALAIREKRAFNEPMYTTTHSVSFVWLAAMVLWVLWPAFVSSLLPANEVAWATITCYLAGIGSVITAYLTCQILQKKVNPLIYTYAMLAGPVAIGAPLLLVGPWGALVIGLVAGCVSALAFIYLQPWLCSKIGALDVMGVHNLHGMAGWVGVFASVILLAVAGTWEAGVSNLVMALIVVAVTLLCGVAVGLALKYTRGTMEDDQLFNDDVDFIKNEDPAEA